MSRISSILIFCTLIFCAFARLQRYNLDPFKTNVGGFSSGGFMATQIHFSHSKAIRGASIISGGPFDCSQGNLTIALSDCMGSPQNLNLNTLLAKALYLAHEELIDPLEYLSGAPVYLFNGVNDTSVYKGVVEVLQKQYEFFGAVVTAEYSITGEHAYLTNSFGSDCLFKGTPYINNCDYYLAFEQLNPLYENKLKQPVSALSENLMQFDQTPYILASNSSLNDIGYIYVPSSCQKGKQCSLSIQLHACFQSLQDIGTDFVSKTGFNEIAESNDIIILYPQAAKDFELDNPLGCWDFWGYTGNDYLSRNAKQISSIWNMVKDLFGQNPENLLLNLSEI